MTSNRGHAQFPPTLLESQCRGVEYFCLGRARRLSPVPYATTSEESNAVKKQAIKDMEIEYCDKGVRLYEALVATGRDKEAERMQTRLRSHFPGERLEAELIKARERASATTTVDERVHR